MSAGVTTVYAHKMRSLLTILGIVIGVASVLAMIAIGDGAKFIILDSFEKIGGANHFRLYRNPLIRKGDRWVRNRSSEYLTREDILAIEAECPSVSGVWGRINYYNILVLAYGGAEKRTGVIGVTPFYEIGMNWGTQQGRFISEADIINSSKACVLAADVSEALFGAENPIGQEVKIILDSEGEWGGRRPNRVVERFKVVGVMKRRGKVISGTWNLDDRLFIPLTTMQERFVGNRYVRTFSIQAKRVDLIDQAIHEVKAVMRRRHRNQDDFFKVDVPKQAFVQLEKASKLIKIALGSIAGFSLLIGGIGIMNMMLVSVTERTREIGLRKAVGAKRRDILLQFLVEAFLMCSVGGLIGVGLGIFAGQGMASIAVRIVKIVPEWPAVISVQWMVIAVAFSSIIGICFGMYPAVKAARLSPIEALRAE